MGKAEKLRSLRLAELFRHVSKHLAFGLSREGIYDSALRTDLLKDICQSFKECRVCGMSRAEIVPWHVHVPLKSGGMSDKLDASGIVARNRVDQHHGTHSAILKPTDVRHRL